MSEEEKKTYTEISIETSNESDSSLSGKMVLRNIPQYEDVGDVDDTDDTKNVSSMEEYETNPYKEFKDADSDIRQGLYIQNKYIRFDPAWIIAIFANILNIAIMYIAGIFSNGYGHLFTKILFMTWTGLTALNTLIVLMIIIKDQVWKKKHDKAFVSMCEAWTLIGVLMFCIMLSIGIYVLVKMGSSSYGWIALLLLGMGISIHVVSFILLRMHMTKIMLDLPKRKRVKREGRMYNRNSLFF